MDKIRVTVKINGNEYIMTGNEGQDEMLKIASYVDGKIKELTSINSKLNPTYASVLAALNITNELFSLREEKELLKNSAQEPMRQLNELKGEYDKLLMENQKLEKVIDTQARDSSRYTEEYQNIKGQYENLYNEYTAKNDELSKLYRDCEILKLEKENKQKELERVKLELSESKYKLIDLQNQLLQNQIDLVKVKKEFDEFRMSYSQNEEKRKIGS
jgi:Uncharacterized protein conserved in bacteria